MSTEHENLQPVERLNGYHTEVFAKTWADRSTLSGLRPLLILRTIYWKLFWLLIFFICFGLSCYQLSESYYKYINQKSTTAIKLVPGAVPFPAVTICNINAFRRSAAAKVPELAKLLLAYEAASKTLAAAGGLIAFAKRKRREIPFGGEGDQQVARSDGMELAHVRVKRLSTNLNPPCKQFWTTTSGGSSNYMPTNGPCGDAIAYRPSGFCLDGPDISSTIYTGDWTMDNICDLVCHRRSGYNSTRLMWQGLQNGSFVNTNVNNYQNIAADGCSWTGSPWFQDGYTLQLTKDNITDGLCRQRDGTFWIRPSLNYSGTPGGVMATEMPPGYPISGQFCNTVNTTFDSFALGDSNCDDIDDMRCIMNGYTYIVHGTDSLTISFPNAEIVQKCIDVTGYWVENISRCYVLVHNQSILNYYVAQGYCSSTYGNSSKGWYGRLATFPDSDTWTELTTNYRFNLTQWSIWPGIGMRSLCGRERWRLFWINSDSQAGPRVDDSWPKSETEWPNGMILPNQTGTETDCAYLHFPNKQIWFTPCSGGTYDWNYICEFGWISDLPNLPAEAISRCGATTVPCGTMYEPAKGPCSSYVDAWANSTWCPHPDKLFAGDFDGDYQCDLMCARSPGDTTYLFGQASGTTFNNSRNITIGPSSFCAGSVPGAQAAVDLNGDGLFDLICRASDRFSAIRNLGPGAGGVPRWDSSPKVYQVDYCSPSLSLTLYVGRADCVDNITDLQCIAQNGTVCSTVMGQSNDDFSGIMLASQCHGVCTGYCLNNGTCSMVAGMPSCNCTAGYGGSKCESVVCTSSYCSNGGVCQMVNNVPTCFCAEGWEGANCDISVDDCASRPCQNGAACVDGYRSVGCICAQDYTGEFCETNINSCNANPCAVNFTCMDYVGGYTCIKSQEIETLATALTHSDLPTNGMSMPSLATDMMGYLLADVDPEKLKELGQPDWSMIEHCSYDKETCTTAEFEYFADNAYGNCYTFNGNQSNTRMAYREGDQFGFHLVISASTFDYLPYTLGAGLKLVIHNPGIAPFPDQGLNIPLNTKSTYQIRYVDMSRQNLKESPCVATNIDKYYYEGSYSVEGCHRSCLQDYVLQYCGCGSPSIPLPPNNGSLSQCGFEKRLCVKYAEEQFPIYVTKGCSHCRSPCFERTTVITQAKSKWTAAKFHPVECNNSTDPYCEFNYSRERASIKIFFQRLMVEESYEFTSYTWFELINDIGNSVGLWIGASLISLVEIVLFFSQIMTYLRFM